MAAAAAGMGGVVVVVGGRGGPRECRRSRRRDRAALPRACLSRAIGDTPPDRPAHSSRGFHGAAVFSTGRGRSTCSNPAVMVATHTVLVRMLHPTRKPEGLAQPSLGQKMRRTSTPLGLGSVVMLTTRILGRRDPTCTFSDKGYKLAREYYVATRHFLAGKWHEQRPAVQRSCIFQALGRVFFFVRRTFPPAAGIP